ncbi:alpha/beta hydrolase [Mesorhizobium sp. L2C084A000]|uniref:alpha/beta fold hydrolase n=1 Tax=unclassified Mesorhizobium TaxID=325217 RepID=UPI001FD903E8|nr:alpha/beta hydrolase [Mesorhizobium sp. L2C084A000]
MDFADALGLSRFAVVGHDWGARISYLLASVFPDRIKCCAALSLGWQPGNQQRRRPDKRKHFGINGSWRRPGALSSYETMARNSPDTSGIAGAH